MFTSLQWWFSFRRNPHFWDWMKEQYTVEELQALVKEATDCSLLRPYNPMDEVFLTSNNGKSREANITETSHRLFNRYQDDIWSICLGAGGYDADNGLTGLACLAKLTLSFQVYQQKTFEEFLVRNALKHTAKQILEQIEKTKTDKR